jgi:hypothetical protein
MSVAHLLVDPVTSPSGEQETTTEVMAIKTAKRHMKPPVFHPGLMLHQRFGSDQPQSQ